MINDTPQTSQTSLVERNISALLARRQAQKRELDWQDRFAERVTQFAGSMVFVWLHVLIFGAWIAAGSGWVPGIPAFDPTLVMLAMAASVEAIFLSTFVLITQNRMQAQADRRADLNLQISLLAEHEITRLVQMVSEMARRMDVPAAHEPELQELKKDVHPEDVLDTISKRERDIDP
jgi:uncharacterized membrane protein